MYYDIRFKFYRRCGGYRLPTTGSICWGGKTPADETTIKPPLSNEEELQTAQFEEVETGSGQIGVINSLQSVPGNLNGVYAASQLEQAENNYKNANSEYSQALYNYGTRTGAISICDYNENPSLLSTIKGEEGTGNLFFTDTSIIWISNTAKEPENQQLIDSALLNKQKAEQNYNNLKQKLEG